MLGNYVCHSLIPGHTCSLGMRLRILVPLTLHPVTDLTSFGVFIYPLLVITSSILQYGGFLGPFSQIISPLQGGLMYHGQRLRTKDDIYLLMYRAELKVSHVKGEVALFPGKQNDFSILCTKVDSYLSMLLFAEKGMSLVGDVTVVPTRSFPSPPLPPSFFPSPFLPPSSFPSSLLPFPSSFPSPPPSLPLLNHSLHSYSTG